MKAYENSVSGQLSSSFHEVNLCQLAVGQLHYSRIFASNGVDSDITNEFIIEQLPIGRVLGANTFTRPAGQYALVRVGDDPRFVMMDGSLVSANTLTTFGTSTLSSVLLLLIIIALVVGLFWPRRGGRRIVANPAPGPVEIRH